MKRSDGEVIRIRHALERLRACIEGAEVGLRGNDPPSADAAAALVQTSMEIATASARLSAYRFAEQDAAGVVEAVPRSDAVGLAGDRCEGGSNCGRSGCPECQQ